MAKQKNQKELLILQKFFIEFVKNILPIVLAPLCGRMKKGKLGTHYPMIQ
jgi:hypothetical protein